LAWGATDSHAVAALLALADELETQAAEAIERESSVKADD
jgi:hypothetical protein